MIELIGEIGINHNGDINLAKKLIDIASIAGFNYVKFQKRCPDICVPEAQKSKPKSTPWGDMTYLDYKKKIEFWSSEYTEIERHCRERGIKWFASVWDIPSAEFMIPFSDTVKIPSAKIIDVNLMSFCRDNFKTVHMSTGMSTQDDIDKAVELCDPDYIYHTNSTYPSPIHELNLNYINYLKDNYPDKKIGYSGHEFGLTTTYAAAAMGVDAIERHITLDHEMWGSDQKSSVDHIGMVKLVRGVRDIDKALGHLAPRVIYDSERDKLNALR